MLQILSILCFMLIGESTFYKTSHGNVKFESTATLEKIVGHSNDLRGILDSRTNAFSFAVKLESFKGFNSELQREHYAENYVEIDRYPDAIFTGKIIEEIDFQKPGKYDVRAKGNFQVHGIRINKIIHSVLTIVNKNQLSIETNFEFNLTEYKIKIPRLVHKKVAESITIHVNLDMKKTE